MISDNNGTSLKEGDRVAIFCCVEPGRSLSGKVVRYGENGYALEVEGYTSLWRVDAHPIIKVGQVRNI